MESNTLTFLGKIVIGLLIVILGMHFLETIIKGSNLTVSDWILVMIAFAALIVAIKDIFTFIWSITGRPLIKRRDRKKVEKLISELRRGKYIASSKRDELVKSIENKLSENPTEEQQKLYIDRYLKVDEIFEKIENVYDSQIIEAKAGLHYFDL